MRRDREKRDLMDKTLPRTDMTPVTDSSEDYSDEDETSDSETDRKEEHALTQTSDFSTMSFEEIISVQNKVGTKAFSKTVQGSQRGKLSGDRVKLNKDRPLEMSAKKPVPILRKGVPAKERIRRDPRFDDLSGEFKPELFHKTYGFLDEIRKKEKEVLEKKFLKARNPKTKKQLKGLLLRMNQQEEAAQQKQKLQEKQAAFKRQQRELAQQGKKPYFLKKSDIRKLELADKYQALKKEGKVEKFLSKKRKRNSIKDRRRLPSQQ